MESMPISFWPPNSFRERLGIHHRLSYDQYSIPTTFQVHVWLAWESLFSDIWSKLTIYPKFQLRLYGHFGYMVNFTRTKPWTLYPKPGVVLFWWNWKVSSFAATDNITDFPSGILETEATSLRSPIMFIFGNNRQSVNDDRRRLN